MTTIHLNGYAPAAPPASSLPAVTPTAPPVPAAPPAISQGEQDGWRTQAVILLRATVGHRDGLSVAGLVAALMFVVWQLARLREFSAPTGSLGMLPFVALNVLLVSATVAMAAHGVNPLRPRLEAAELRVGDATAQVHAGVEELGALRSDYQDVREQLVARDQNAVHHVALLSHHGQASIYAWEGAVREGMPEPSTNPLYGRHRAPEVSALVDPVGFLASGTTPPASDLPADLPYDDVLDRLRQLLGATAPRASGSATSGPAAPLVADRAIRPGTRDTTAGSTS